MLNPATTVRAYTPADAPALLRLFRRTIHTVNARDYSREQLDAWAPAEIDPVAWAARFEGRFAVVAELDGAPAGFADLTAEGRLDRFYVDAAHQRRRIGSAMWRALLERARQSALTQLSVEASITARPFFESLGFVTQAEQQVERRGAVLTNFLMVRPLG